MKIGRSYYFSAAHHLPKVPEDHKCRRVHGHNYRVDIVISGALDDRGFVEDFAEIDNMIDPLVQMLDHRLLNDIDGLSNPTAENIAIWFSLRTPDYYERIRVYETEDSWAEITR